MLNFFLRIIFVIAMDIFDVQIMNQTITISRVQLTLIIIFFFHVHISKLIHFCLTKFKSCKAQVDWFIHPNLDFDFSFPLFFLLITISLYYHLVLIPNNFFFFINFLFFKKGNIMIMWHLLFLKIFYVTFQERCNIFFIFIFINKIFFYLNT